TFVDDDAGRAEGGADDHDREAGGDSRGQGDQRGERGGVDRSADEGAVGEEGPRQRRGEAAGVSGDRGTGAGDDQERGGAGALRRVWDDHIVQLLSYRQWRAGGRGEIGGRITAHRGDRIHV